MDLKRLPLDRLRPAPFNPRKDLGPDDPEYVALARSIARWGIVEPIVWNKQTNTVVAGHQRLKVLQQANVDETDVVVVDLPEDEERALGVALNKIHGEFTYPALPDLLSELDANGFDVTLTGFSEPDLEKMLAGAPDPRQAKTVTCPKCGEEFSP
jgi:ParB-like chromosome segregation protein Spo0J